MASRATTLILLAVVLLGFAQIAFLPPFEGFDEIAHLSYVQQIADTGTFPRLGRDPVSVDVENYPGPLPYSFGPPDRTYRIFLNEGRVLPAKVELLYTPGHSPNWEAQHPPLYYVALVPFYKLAQNWDWASLLLLLRAVSWILAFTGFVIGAWATLRALPEVPPLAHLIVVGWPLLLPEFFVEMARLGNDSLCLLIMSIAWALLLRFLKRRDFRTAVFLGLMLGLGLWTKAFFIPLTGGIVLFLGFIGLRDRDIHLLRCTALTAVVAGLTGCGWYVDGYLATGGLGFLHADKVEDFWHVLPQAFDLPLFLHGLGAMVSSFVWSGTWSFATFSKFYSVPVVVFLALMFAGWYMRLRRTDDALIAPAFIAGPVLVGLVAHWLTQMTLANAGNGTPGWYLHILSGPLTLALASGCWWPRPRLLRALCVYTLAFHVACWLAQLSVFSGCAYREGDNTFILSGDCFISLPRLAVLGWPTLGTLAIMGALLALGGSFAFNRTKLSAPS